MEETGYDNGFLIHFFYAKTQSVAFVIVYEKE